MPRLCPFDDRRLAVIGPGRALRERLFADPTPTRPTPIGGRRRQPRMGGGVVPAARLGGAGPHQQRGRGPRPRHAGLGPRLRRRGPAARRDPRRRHRATGGGGDGYSLVGSPGSGLNPRRPTDGARSASTYAARARQTWRAGQKGAIQGLPD